MLKEEKATGVIFFFFQAKINPTGQERKTVISGEQLLTREKYSHNPLVKIFYRIIISSDIED